MLTAEEPPPPELLRELAGPVEGLLCMLTDRIDTALLDAAPNLRVVSNYAVGTDNIDVAACVARNVRVGNTPDVLTDATADLAFALMLAAARDLVGAQRTVRDGGWGPWSPANDLGRDVHGTTLVIVGAGRIGQAVARRAAGFDMKIITVGRNDDLHAALRQADFISIHTPLTEQTHHLIDAGALAHCKPTAILVNTARGGIVDQQALKEALENGRLAAAALDVTEPEPLPPDDPLLQAPNLLVVPHIGSATETARSRMADLAVDNLLAGLDGARLPHEVTA
jgi:glyoxylate reductase